MNITEKIDKYLNEGINVNRYNKLLNKIPEQDAVRKLRLNVGGTLIHNVVYPKDNDKSFVAKTNPNADTVMDELAYRLGFFDKKNIMDKHEWIEEYDNAKQVLSDMLAIGKEMMSWKDVNARYYLDGKVFRQKRTK